MPFFIERGDPMENGKFYFIKDEYLEKYDLMQNKGQGHSRPFFCGFEDPSAPSVYWVTPISSKIEKYEQQYEHKLDTFGKCDTIDFIYLKNHKQAVVIKSTFPVTDKYVEDVYRDHNTKRPFELKLNEQNRIHGKIERLMSLQHAGHNFFYYDIYDMRVNLIHEQQLDNMYQYTRSIDQDNEPDIDTNVDPLEEIAGIHL